MFGTRLVKGAAVCLAILGIMIPQAPVLADSAKAKPVVKSATANRAPDVFLTEGGVLSGRVCDHSGKVLEGTKVVLKQDGKVVGTTTTDKNGVYSFRNVKAGLYSPCAGNTEGLFRVWNAQTAPPSAKGHALLVMGENGARGQFGSIDPTLVLLTAGVIAAAVLSGVAISKIDKLQNKIDDLSASP